MVFTVNPTYKRFSGVTGARNEAGATKIFQAAAGKAASQAPIPQTPRELDRLTSTLRQRSDRLLTGAWTVASFRPSSEKHLIDWLTKDVVQADKVERPGSQRMAYTLELVTSFLEGKPGSQQQETIQRLLEAFPSPAPDKAPSKSADSWEEAEALRRTVPAQQAVEWVRRGIEHAAILANAATLSEAATYAPIGSEEKSAAEAAADAATKDAVNLVYDLAKGDAVPVQEKSTQQYYDLLSCTRNMPIRAQRELAQKLSENPSALDAVSQQLVAMSDRQVRGDPKHIRASIFETLNQLTAGMDQPLAAVVVKHIVETMEDNGSLRRLHGPAVNEFKDNKNVRDIVDRVKGTPIGDDAIRKMNEHGVSV